ncbi:MAG: hypothetical protein WCB04_08650 [Mycobacteriales bacterium]
MTRRTRRVPVAVLAVGLLCLSAACGGGFSKDSGSAQKSGKASLQILIGSSGDAETKAVKDAAGAWASKTGNTVKVTPAQNLDQQLGQAFAANKPPDVFYLDASKFADYANQNALYAYGDKTKQLADFYPALKDAFTYKGTFYCAPKDFSTLALEVNTDLWTKAGLTKADYPKTWDQLTTVSTTLKAKLPGVTPLVISPERDRVNAFLVQAGGTIVDKNGKVTADTPANVEGLTYAKSLLTKGLMKYSSAVGAGWGGEAFGKTKSAMTIEGNWIAGAMKTDFPGIKYDVAPLPEGPKGQGTLAFTVCWGIPQASKFHDQAVDFVNTMTAQKQQLEFAKAFGVMPSITTARDAYLAQFPTNKVFMDGADYSAGPIKAPKVTEVLADYNNSLSKLATSDPQQILVRLQKNLQQATGG